MSAQFFGNVVALLGLSTLASMVMVATSPERDKFGAMLLSFTIGVAFLLSVFILIEGAK